MEQRVSSLSAVSKVDRYHGGGSRRSGSCEQPEGSAIFNTLMNIIRIENSALGLDSRNQLSSKNQGSNQFCHRMARNSIIAPSKPRTVGRRGSKMESIDTEYLRSPTREDTLQTRVCVWDWVMLDYCDQSWHVSRVQTHNPTLSLTLDSSEFCTYMSTRTYIDKH